MKRSEMKRRRDPALRLYETLDRFAKRSRRRKGEKERVVSLNAREDDGAGK